MVQLLGPVNSSEARGKLGGIVYNTTRGIHYARSLVTPANQYTPRRLTIRALAKAATSRWQTISDQLRAEWNIYASFHPEPRWTGKRTNNSGYNWFVRTNVRLLDMGASIIDTPPYRTNAWPLSALDATPSADTIVLTWSLPTDAPTSTLTVDVWLTRAMSPGRQPKIEDAKHRNYSNSEAAGYTITSLGHGHYGIFCRVIDEATGLATPWQITYADITAGLPETAGPFLASHTTDQLTASPHWVTPDQILTYDLDEASCTTDPGPDGDKLLVYGFGFAIPLSASITGLEVRTFTDNSDDIQSNAQLWSGSALIGTVKSHLCPGNGGTQFTDGGPADIWGATLTPLALNNPLFGVVLNATIVAGYTIFHAWLDAKAYYTT